MDEIEKLDKMVAEKWVTSMNHSLLNNITSKEALSDKRLIAVYLIQVFHYAVHTPRHQALVGVNANNKDIHYMQYCFEHALEETGHELMALNDLASMGFEIDPEKIPNPLRSTELLISYMYRVAQSASPIHHLGYGFWSENACPFIDTFMQNLMKNMGLKKNQMTFYFNHVTIDEKHAQEVRNTLVNTCKTNADWEGVKSVAETTMELTLGIMEDTFMEYSKLIKGENTPYSEILK